MIHKGTVKHPCLLRYNRTMKRNTLYNLIFPVWLLIYIPGPWIFLLIPLNFLVDTLVLYFSMGRSVPYREICEKYGMKICAVGFLADLIGSVFLFAVLLLSDSVLKPLDELYGIANGISYQPTKNLPSFLIVLLAILLSGLCIYLLDKRIFKKAGMELNAAKRHAFNMAFFTMPYLYLLPYGFWQWLLPMLF